MRLPTRASASAVVISFGKMRSYACYPSSELVGEGISVLVRFHSQPLLTGLHWQLCTLIVLCVRRIVWLLRLGFIPAVGAASPPLLGGVVSRSVSMAVARAFACPMFLRGLLAVGSEKHRTFAVLLWALRVPPTSAAARFSSIVPSVFLGSLIEDDHHQAVDPPCGYEHIVF